MANMETMSGKWKWISVACSIVCVFAPIVIFVLTMTNGATEWREDNEPVPTAARVIYVLFLFDVFSTCVLIWAMAGRRWVTTFAAIPLLGIAAVCAFWGGLWVSGQWL
jgi:hypothetical protein